MSLATASIGPGALSKSHSTATVVIAGGALAPAMGPIGNEAEADEAPDAGGYISVYTVRSGDTIKTIAAMFDVTPSTVMWANDLTPTSKLKEGMMLTISPISGRLITLKAGDTFQSLSKKYGIPAATIAFLNEMSLDDTLTVGEMLTIPDENLAAPTDKPTTAKPSTAKPSVQKPSAGNYFIYPLPTSGSRFVRGLHGNCYCGIDISAKTGTPIYAVADGSVIISKSTGYNAGWGSYVVINHTLPNGKRAQTLSAHMSRVVATVGQKVKAGDVIGYVGTTGNVTGAHLHLEVTGVSNPFTDPKYGR